MKKNTMNIARATAVSALLLLSGATFATETMQHDAMKPGQMRKDGMKPEPKSGKAKQDRMVMQGMEKESAPTARMAKEGMVKNGMAKDGMAKDDMAKDDMQDAAMTKGEMKK